MPTVTLLRRTYKRGRGPMRTRVIVRVAIVGEQAWGYKNGYGFYEDPGHPTWGVDINTVLPDKILNVKGDVVEPKVRAVTDFDFDAREESVLLGNYFMLDFDNLVINNYTGPYKRLFVRAYGVLVAPGWGEQADCGPLTSGSFDVELEFTSISGAEG
jgi:hypothetical protein